MNNPVLTAIYTRRSVREFNKTPVPNEKIIEIIRAGTWAPSGLNNQPWRFAIVKDRELISKISELTKYQKTVEQANVLIPVFIDKNAMYNNVKDHQAIGACIQNMLLAAHSMELGAVWLGEILKSASALRELLKLPDHLELMAVIAVGYPLNHDQSSTRKPLEEVLVYVPENFKIS